MSIVPDGGTKPQPGYFGLWLWMIRRAIKDAEAGNGHSQEAREWLLDHDGWHEIANLNLGVVDAIRQTVRKACPNP